MLPAAEAVQAAKAQSLHASEALDRALRRAFFRDGRCITLRHEIIEVAARVDAVDVEALSAAIDRGSARAPLMQSFARAREVADGSPHVFLRDGSDFANPGMEMAWDGEAGRGFPRIERDDASVYDEIVRRAAVRKPAA